MPWVFRPLMSAPWVRRMGMLLFWPWEMARWRRFVRWWVVSLGFEGEGCVSMNVRRWGELWVIMWVRVLAWLK